MIGYFEGLGSERAIAWRVADSLALRRFLGYALTDSTPDHSSLSRIRGRLPVEVGGLRLGAERGWPTTTCSRARRWPSTPRRWKPTPPWRRHRAPGHGPSPTPSTWKGWPGPKGLKPRRSRTWPGSTRSVRTRRPNKDWEHPHDADARIAKMKDGRTHLAHKAEHTVDADTQALVAVQVCGADTGDTESLNESLAQGRTQSETGSGR